MSQALQNLDRAPVYYALELGASRSLGRGGTCHVCAGGLDHLELFGAVGLDKASPRPSDGQRGWAGRECRRLGLRAEIRAGVVVENRSKQAIQQVI
jgi:hypothetical protein